MPSKASTPERLPEYNLREIELGLTDHELDLFPPASTLTPPAAAAVTGLGDSHAAKPQSPKKGFKDFASKAFTVAHCACSTAVITVGACVIVTNIVLIAAFVPRQ